MLLSLRMDTPNYGVCLLLFTHAVTLDATLGPDAARIAGLAPGFDLAIATLRLGESWLQHAAVVDTGAHAKIKTAVAPAGRLNEWRVVAGLFPCGADATQARWRYLGAEVACRATARLAHAAPGHPPLFV